MASLNFINIIEIAKIIAFGINNIRYKWYKTNVSIILWFVIFHNYTMYAPLIPDDQPTSSTTLSKKKKRFFFYMWHITWDTWHVTHFMERMKCDIRLAVWVNNNLSTILAVKLLWFWRDCVLNILSHRITDLTNQ